MKKVCCQLSPFSHTQVWGDPYTKLVRLKNGINNHFAKKRGIGKNLLLAVRTVMLQEQVDVVAGDFNGAAWRRQSGSDPRPVSIIEEAFVNTFLPVPPGPTPLWGSGGVPGEWSDVCGFFKPPGSEKEWQIRMHGAFTIPFELLGIRHTDQSCHHEIQVHFLHVNARLVDSYITGRQISSTKFEKVELTVKRDHSHPRYVSPM